MEKVPMTPQGHQRLEQELKHLKSVERLEIIKAISDAREHGDLSENAEYHAARERQSFCEGRIAELEDVLSRSEVIDVPSLAGSIIKFGATVTMVDEDTDEETTYQVVGQIEADINAGRISTTSPIGRALIGKSVGESVEVTVPGGTKAYEILSVTFA
ncbi:transcription elongation factor GreA [Thalassospira sp.]|uniref:transcription elongation factor GreA n=1 Tax=Thalassospira sp. TaxID=1912094 RepID=UPI002733D1D8|nr:transcription elongation factor GreA [Thalassospira sp.]MDP2697162.1 transcription elongation factor GreA [Thalassospira sp.]